MRFIDYRSDTVTTPTKEMRYAMAEAIVGDDVYCDDPTVKLLEERAAAVTGKEAALFVPSGTMGNQLAIMSSTQRGDEIIVEESCHILEHEVGATAVISGVQLRIIKGTNGVMSPRDVENAIREEDIHYPRTSMVCLENALSNGTVVPIDNMKAIYEVAKKHSLSIHLDGARLFNAAAYLGVSAFEITRYTDSVMFCLSKGLCAPVGSILAGGTHFIEKARKNRKLLGGGMRQAGILAAAGLIAIADMTKRLHVDHENALYLAQGLAKIPGITVDIESTHINMVFFDVTNTGLNSDSLLAFLYEKGIKANGAYKGVFRFVTNNDVSRQDIEYTLGCIKSFIEDCAHAGRT